MDLLLLLVAIGVTATQVKRRKCGSQHHVSGCRTATGDVRPKRSSIRSRSTSHNLSDESRSLSGLSDSCSSNASGHNTAERLVDFCRLCLDFGVLERVRLDPRCSYQFSPPKQFNPTMADELREFNSALCFILNVAGIPILSDFSKGPRSARQGFGTDKFGLGHRQEL